LFQRALDESPAVAILEVEVAAELCELGRLKDARAVLHALLSRRPRFVPAWIGLGKVERRRGQQEAALDAFRRGQALNPGHAAIPLEVARTLRELGRFTEALECLKDCDVSHPNPSLVWQIRGSIASYRNEVDQALHCFDMGISMQPDVLACYRSKIDECLSSGLFGCAEETLRAGFVRMPTSSVLRLLNVRLHQARGQIPAALQLARMLAQEAPEDPEVGLLLAAVYFTAGCFSEAEQMLQSLQTETAGQQFRRSMQFGHLAMARLRAAEAEQHYLAALQIHPDAHEAHVQRAQMQLLQGSYDGCRISLCRAEELVGQHPSLRVREFHSSGINATRDMLAANAGSDELLSEFERVLAKPLADRPAVLARNVTREQCPFGVPLALLTSLSHLGIFSHPRPNFCRQPIPKQIVQYWDSPEVPAALAQTMCSWPEQCPEYRYTLFNRQSACEFIAEECGFEASKAFASCAQPTLRSDLFRLAYLSVYGGVYVDADDRCLEDISPWLDEDNCGLVLYIEILGSIGNNFVAAAPRHPFIAAAFATVTQNILERRGDNVWHLSGPGAITAAFCRHYARDLGQSLSPPGVRLCEQADSRRRICMHVRHAYKRDGHHWNSPKSRQTPLFEQRSSTSDDASPKGALQNPEAGIIAQ
jgi:tetratricopeptide (TPR) repeat protein